MNSTRPGSPPRSASSNPTAPSGSPAPLTSSIPSASPCSSSASSSSTTFPGSSPILRPISPAATSPTPPKPSSGPPRTKKSRHTFNYKLMKETNRGKQMKSVWEIRPPESWEKKFGKHPTQKPAALLERILLASTNEGDLVLDPFLGGGTTLLTAFRLCRHALGCELSAEFLSLSLRRMCSNLVQVDLSLSCVQFSLDPFPNPMDRSCRTRFCRRAPLSAGVHKSEMTAQLQLVQQERRFYFIGRTKREVIFSVLADSLDDARQKFRASGRPDSDALFIIKTETEIYLA